MKVHVTIRVGVHLHCLVGRPVSIFDYALQSSTHLHSENTHTHQMLRCRITILTVTFLTNFKISNFNKEHMSSLKMI